MTSATASAPLIDLASFPESTATPAPSMSSARVLCDSVSPDGYRVSTLVVELPRSDLGHLRAYRKFSQNAASSRAIPVSRMIAAAEDRPYIPRQFSLKHRGMDTDRFIEPGDPRWPAVVHWWLQCRDAAVASARTGLEMGLHKQVVNRILEPFLMHTSIVSSTSWQNFFDQRLALNDHGLPLADPPMFDLATAIKAALERSSPTPLGTGGWHLPLTGFPGDEALDLPHLIQVSTARCARVSYLTHDGRRDVSADMELFERLLYPAGPGSASHLSPFEHPATPLPSRSLLWSPGSNFDGWLQLRKHVERGDFSPFGLVA